MTNGILDSGQKIITDGLVLNLDAAQLRSYPTTGTTWTNLSGNNNNVTLVNGPTFNSSNGGSIVFDGVNDYLTISPLTLNTNTGFTIDLWIYINDPQSVYPNFWSYWFSTGTLGFEWGTYASGSLQGVFIFKDSGASGGPSISSPQIGNKWANVVFGCNITTPFMYTDGIQSGTAGNFRNTNIVITEIMRYLSSRYYRCRQSSVRIYNRALSAQEIQQNFDATKSRYGL